MSSSKKLDIYFVLGEESGDALGVKILEAFNKLSIEANAMGLAGHKMQATGVKSLFDISELSIMGITGVVSKLPNLLKRINQTAKDIIEKKPDVLLLIDSPDFSYRVAKKVRKAQPDIKIIKFVAPTVWAWRPGRAKKIAPFVDHILAILPFEPDLMKQLEGPQTTYVGHPLATDLPAIKTGDRKIPKSPVKLVVLPGSRGSEIKPLLPVIQRTLARLDEISDLKYEITLPAVPKLEQDIRDAVASWENKPTIVVGEESKKSALMDADVALCASGTVTLELAVHKVPMISIYKLDRLMMIIRHLITAWSAALPSLIVDYPFIPERMNEYANPENIARLLNRLSMKGPERDTQLQGFDEVIKKLKQKEASELVAARKILEIVAK